MEKEKKGAACLSVLIVCLSLGLQYADLVAASERPGEHLVYQDVSDEAQIRHMPRLSTTVYDEDTGIHISQADSDVTIIDEVRYENLVPKREYTLRGVLIDRDTKKVKTDSKGNDIAVQAEFIPAKAEGSVELGLRFDGSGYAGETLAVYEELLCNGKRIAGHESSEDPEKAIYFPKITTVVSNQKTREKSISAYHLKALEPGNILRILLCIYVFLFMICGRKLVRLELRDR